MTRFPRAGVIAPLVALTLLLSACGAGAGSGSGAQNAAQKVATPTATVAIPTLNWRKITTPIDLSHGGVSLAVSPVNGREA
jgi:predicted small secreted protein